MTVHRRNSRDGFRHYFMDNVKLAAAAGYTTNEEIGLYCCDGAAASTVTGWRNKYPHFDKLCRTALAHMGMELTGRMLQFSREGSESATKFLLERRVDAFKPKQEITHRGNSALQTLLANRMSESEALDRGLLIEVDDEE